MLGQPTPSIWDVRNQVNKEIILIYQDVLTKKATQDSEIWSKVVLCERKS